MGRMCGRSEEGPTSGGTDRLPCLHQGHLELDERPPPTWKYPEHETEHQSAQQTPSFISGLHNFMASNVSFSTENAQIVARVISGM